MSEILDVMAVVGSLRRDSFNRRLAQALAAIAPEALRIEVIHLGELPLYNQDDEQAPARVTALFRDRVRRADAVLFVTPEYNRSIPGVLKNAIDIGSRPYGQNVWAGVNAHLDTVTQQAAAPVIAKYTGVLAAADVAAFTVSTTFTVLQSIRLDLGTGSRVHP